MFLRNELEVFNGLLFKDIEPPLDNSLMLTIYINNLQSELEILNWYKLLNFGGTPHSEEEKIKIENMIKQIEGNKL